MTTGAFLDKASQPTGDEILSALAASRPLWEALTGFVADAYRVEGETLFAGKKDGWAVRYRKGGKSLLWMFPRKGSFRALVVLGEAAVEKALAAPISAKTRSAIEGAHQYHDGRWVYMPVESEQDIDDIQQLLVAKASPARRRRSA
jgi:hypothetical protein